MPEAVKRGNRKMLYLIEQYKQANPDDQGPVRPHVVAPWVLREGLYRDSPPTLEEILRRRLSRALGTEYIEDPQGRSVRANHPIFKEVVTADGVKRRSEWYGIFEAPTKIMRQSLALRRRAALADVLQLKLDFDSYNDNNVFGESLDELDFNFNKDIEEGKLPKVYPEARTEDWEDEEEDS